jgi:hypothetical protein
MMNGLYFLNLVSKTDIRGRCPTRWRCADGGSSLDLVWTKHRSQLPRGAARPTPPPTIMAIASALPRLLTATALPRPQ